MQGLDGVFSVVVSGIGGASLGVIEIRDGRLHGNTTVGARFDGTAKLMGDGSISLSVSMTTPPGTRPVWGGVASENFQTRTAELLLPPNTLAQGKPHLLPAYELWVIIQRVSEEFARLAGPDGRRGMIEVLQRADDAWKRIAEAQ